MKVNRAQLLATLNKAIDAEEAKQRAEHARRLADEAKAVQGWRTAHSDAQLAAARALVTKLRRGGVTTRQDANAFTQYLFNGGPSNPEFIFRVPQTWAALKLMLEVVTDEEVTTNSLAAAGFRNLNNILARMT